MEAMAAGVPLVASAAGGIRETVRDGENGSLVRPRDVADLAKALDRVLADREAAAAMAARGRDLAVANSIDTLADATLETYAATSDVMRSAWAGSS